MTTTPDIKKASELYAAAVEMAELAMARLKGDRRNERLRIRCCRALRRCERCRMLLKMHIETAP